VARKLPGDNVRPGSCQGAALLPGHPQGPRGHREDVHEHRAKRQTARRIPETARAGRSGGEHDSFSLERPRSDAQGETVALRLGNPRALDRALAGAPEARQCQRRPRKHD